MKKDIVVTNLRIQKHDWLQLKTTAAELGMSVNEYVNFLLQDTSIKRELGFTSTSKSRYQNSIPVPLWELNTLARHTKPKSLGPLSVDDKLVYEN